MTSEDSQGRTLRLASGVDPDADSWIADLTSAPGPRASAAHERLRALVARAVQKAIARRGLPAAPFDRATLEDLVQIAVVRVLASLQRFEGRSRFSTWAWAVAVHAALDELRRRDALTRRSESAEDRVALLEAPAAPPESRAERREIVERMQRIIAEELTERQRAAVLGELAGTPQPELLAHLGIGRNAFYKLIHDARRKLRQGLLAAGIEEDHVREAFDL